jgi:hypothetical protein
VDQLRSHMFHYRPNCISTVVCIIKFTFFLVNVKCMHMMRLVANEYYTSTVYAASRTIYELTDR